MEWDKLYEATFMQVYSYVLTLCSDRSLAEEICEEAFFRAMTASQKASFRDGSSELTWLCAIAKNLYVDEMRKRRRYAELPENMASNDEIEDRVADEDEAFRIHRALHSLDEPYREVFSLRVFGELPFAKIALLFGKTESWARVTYHRAKLMIQERMG